VWSSGGSFLLCVAMVLSTLLVVWRHQGKSFMVQQVRSYSKKFRMERCLQITRYRGPSLQ
jgi:hypothetical protein